ncbi:MAG: hypothetical protein LBB09_02285 [Rickettsiales bacterium]|nr:hypothetical protein [Rickettsiales bacterium]
MKKNNFAFSLVELSVVLVVMGFMLIGAIDVTKSVYNATKQSDTRQKMRVIEKAIDAYIISNKKLPCPSGIKLTVSNSAYGRENCAENSAAGIKMVGGGKAIMGAVPVYELNLETRYMFDGWDNKITFMVVKDYTGVFNNFFNKKLPPSDLINSKFSYALISYGKNRIGGVNYDGIAENMRFIDNATAGEKKNIFSLMTGLTIQEFRDVAKFDDIVVAKNKENIIHDLEMYDIDCVVDGDLGSLLGARCNNFSFANINVGDTLTYREKIFSNPREENREGYTVDRHCIIECASYGVINIYVAEKIKGD